MTFKIVFATIEKFEQLLIINFSVCLHSKVDTGAFTLSIMMTDILDARPLVICISLFFSTFLLAD